MSRIDDLIRTHCPGGVDHRTLGEIGELLRGNGLPKSDFTESGVGAIHYGQIYTYYGTWTTETISHVAPETAARLVKVDPGDVIITNTSENLDDVGKAVAWLGDAQIVTGGHATVFKHDQEAKFISYWLQSPAFQRQKKKLATGTKVIDISAKQLATVRMPVPPLAVQQEIVRVLDVFESLEAELEAELNERRAERDALRTILPRSKRIKALTPERPNRIAIGNIAKKFVNPVRVDPDVKYTNLGVKWYGEGVFAREPKLGSAIKASTLYRVKPGQFIYNRMFVTEGSFGLVTEDLADGVVSGEFPVYELDTSRVVPEWLYMYFQDPVVVNAAAAETTGGTKSRRRWKEEQFEAFQIELPSVAAQREIVQRTQAFTGLVALLEAEIAARRKQYEYYRDRLLSFEEAEA